MTLREIRNEDGLQFLEAVLGDDGSLTINGQDLGDGVERFWGQGLREYEWTRTVDTQHIPQLVAALGGHPDSDVLALIAQSFTGEAASRLDSFLQDSGIPYEPWSRLGD